MHYVQERTTQVGEETMPQGSNFESFRLPKSIIQDLPKRSQGGLFWDVTEDPDLQGGPAIFFDNFYF